VESFHKKEKTMKPLFRFLAALLAVALLSSLLPGQTVRAAGILYAAPVASGSANCTSWVNACTLASALLTASSGDQIWVKQGVHYPGTNQTSTFTLNNNVAIYGGFAGTETSLGQRNWQTNLTILSGDIDKNDTDANSNGIIEPGLGDSIQRQQRLPRRHGPERDEQQRRARWLRHHRRAGEWLIPQRRRRRDVQPQQQPDAAQPDLQRQLRYLWRRDVQL
jgi:hypothetical protein